MLQEKYRPKKIALFIGNEESRLALVKWLKHWKLGSKPVILTGPPGVGKSSSVYAVADEFGFKVVEFNASDVRTRERLRVALGPMLQNENIFDGQEKMLVFLDEIDGLSGRSDYAGMDFVLDFIENASVPVAMAANVEEDPKLKKIEQRSSVLRFRPVEEGILRIYLKVISRSENLGLGDHEIEEIALRSHGDVRFALNILQTVTGSKAAREQKDSQFFSDSEALRSILAAKSLKEALLELRQFDAPPRDKIRSFFDSVASAKNLDAVSRAASLMLIAQADLTLGEINATQSWRLLRYMDRYLALSALFKDVRATDSGIPWNLRLSIWNDGRVIRQVASDASGCYHASRSDFASLYLPYFAYCFRKDRELLKWFMQKNDLPESAQRIMLKVGSGKS